LVYGNQQTEKILKQAKLEGVLTANHVEAARLVQQTIDTGIAACGSSMKKIHIAVKRDGIELSVNSDDRI
jgi:hypothetical protein